MKLPPMKDDPNLSRLIEESKARVAAMSPEELRAMRAEQRRSWVRGELMLEHHDMTIEEANRFIEEAENGK